MHRPFFIIYLFNICSAMNYIKLFGQTMVPYPNNSPKVDTPTVYKLDIACICRERLTIIGQHRFDHSPTSPFCPFSNYGSPKNTLPKNEEKIGENSANIESVILFFEFLYLYTFSFYCFFVYFSFSIF